MIDLDHATSYQAPATRGDVAGLLRISDGPLGWTVAHVGVGWAALFLIDHETSPWGRWSGYHHDVTRHDTAEAALADALANGVTLTESENT